MSKRVQNPRTHACFFKFLYGVVMEVCSKWYGKSKDKKSKNLIKTTKLKLRISSFSAINIMSIKDGAYFWTLIYTHLSLSSAVFNTTLAPNSMCKKNRENPSYQPYRKLVYRDLKSIWDSSATTFIVTLMGPNTVVPRPCDT